MATEKFTDAQKVIMRKGLEGVVNAVRRQADIAAHCGISRQAVTQMISRGYVVAEHVQNFIAIAAKHRLVIGAWELRPDLYPEPKKAARK